MLKHYSNIFIRTPCQSLSKIGIDPTIGYLDSSFEEGIYISSPQFWEELKKKSDEKINLTLLKFWIRSCTRCTPYSTFAGIGVAEIKNDTQLIINNDKNHKRYIKVDNTCINIIVDILLSNKDMRSQFMYNKNNSLYLIGDSYRYIKCDVQNRYSLNNICKTDYLDAIIKSAEFGVTFKSMCNILINSFNIDETESASFINELINSKVVISELEICVTGDKPLHNLLSKLKKYNYSYDWVIKLANTIDLLENSNSTIFHYKEIIKQLHNITDEKCTTNNLLHVDLFLSHKKLHVEKELVETILSQCSDLSVFSRKNNNPDLEEFKTKFHQKYEDLEIPLFIALDTDIGIGYAGINAISEGECEIIDDILLYKQQNTSADFDSLQQMSLLKYEDYIVNNKTYIEIKEEDIEGYKNINIIDHTLPFSMFLIGNLLRSNEKLNAKEFFFSLSAWGGPSAANLLGRFTQGDEKLTNVIREIISHEESEDNDVIYAEIVHFPDSRAGNILLRAILRKYEIPYIGTSGVSSDFQIPVSDLMVSIQNNEIILRSKKHNKRVIPRLTTAHNFTNGSLPMYKFLCDLQYQNYSLPVIWDWGNLFVLKHLPRVVYKNIILKKAQWRIDHTDLYNLPPEKEEYPAYILSFRQRLCLPAQVCYVDKGRELLLNLDYINHICILVDFINRKKSILLEEFLFTEGNCVITDVDNNPFINEVIIPVYNTQNTTFNRLSPAKPLIKYANIRRKFTPNSEWLYFKIYCGTRQADTILKEIIVHLVENNLDNKLFEKFFFVRYKDELPHLRIRFYNSDLSKQNLLQQALLSQLQPFLDSYLIDNVLLDTYTRELERYQHYLIEETETIFFHDSITVLRFINSSVTQRIKIFFALRSIDEMLNDFNMDLLSKRDLLKQLQTSYFREFGSKPETLKKLNEKYRNYQKDIFSYLNPRNDIANSFFNMTFILKTRSKQNKPIIIDIKEKLIENGNSNGYLKLLPSYIHMFMNRLYISQQRKYELVIYHFLEKYYTSQIAILSETKAQ